jgi:hypothetical protein
MNKTSRLSFRIEANVSQRIDELINLNPDIRDRTDFGTKSVMYYLNALEKEEEDMTLVIKALISLAESLDMKNDANVKKLKKAFDAYNVDFNKY